MTCIEISDLTIAASESLANADSFLNELQKSATTQIFGGSRGADKSWDKKDDSSEADCYYSYKEDCDYSYYYKEKCC